MRNTDLDAGSWKIQSEYGDPNGGVREMTEEAEEVCQTPGEYVAEDGHIWHQCDESPLIL